MADRALDIEVSRSFTAQDVIPTLQYLFAVRGAPKHIRSDNDPEFIAKNIQRWLERTAVNTLYINKASPWENAHPAAREVLLRVLGRPQEADLIERLEKIEETVEVGQ